MCELLAPAGNIECANVAIRCGADAVYLGATTFSARQSAENFDLSTLCEYARKARFYGVKTYVAMNTMVKNGELEEFLRVLLCVWNAGVDAIILQDALLGKAIKEKYPEIVLHLSTQAGICNENGAIFAKNCGFSRVILARETPIDEIEKITKIIETEVFVQGALCTAYSGQCYFSSFVGGNSGNRGRCKQPCRKLYSYDRNGKGEKCYALSLSDLCVGEDIEKLVKVGVTSFKIEGRMRRAEYVGASVRYYRALLDGKADTQLFSDLKRTYNRGNYTKGLAFGQDKRFLSTAIQGHLGEKVGVLKVVNGKYFVESRFLPKIGDAFKILRDGKEVGGATFEKLQSKGFSVLSKTKLKNGDCVFITTDTSVNERVFNQQRDREVHIQLNFTENQPPVAVIDTIKVVGERPLQSAKNQSLTHEDLFVCFRKTDGLSCNVIFDEVTINGNVFIAKSELNAFRRRCFDELTVKQYTTYEYVGFNIPTVAGKNQKKAVIASDFEDIHTDIAIYKATDYNKSLPQSFLQGKLEKYLYYPPFCTSVDERAIDAWLQQANIDGIYAENYGAIEFAKQRNLKLFIGTGLNVCNAVALGQISAEYYALSKELNDKELQPLLGGRSFVLKDGGIKLMDLSYCPFEKTCNICDKKSLYFLADENDRRFPVRRYLDGKGNCRFELYNCNRLINDDAKNTAGALSDLSVDIQNYFGKTSGHAKRGVL